MSCGPFNSVVIDDDVEVSADVDKDFPALTSFMLVSLTLEHP